MLVAMAEIRKHNPVTSDIGQQVREQLGETVRPVTPGTPKHEPGDDDYDPFDQADEAKDDPEPAISAGGGPLIGVLPEGFNPFVFEDE